MQRPIIDLIAPQINIIRKMSFLINAICLVGLGLFFIFVIFPSMGARLGDWATFSSYKKIGILTFLISLLGILLITIFSKALPLYQSNLQFFWDDLLFTPDSISINNEGWIEPKRIPSVDIKTIILTQRGSSTKTRDFKYQTFLEIVTNDKERIDLRVIYLSPDAESNQNFYSQLHQFIEQHYRIIPKSRAPLKKSFLLTLLFGLGIVAGNILILLF